jgi:hypothetical protein
MATASENFTAANGTAISSLANWEYVRGSGSDLQVQSNGLTWDGTTNDDVGARWKTSSASFSANHFARLRFASVAAQDSGLGVGVRMGAAGSSAYYGFYVQGNGNAAWTFRHSGTFSELSNTGTGFATPPDLTTSDDIALYVVGQALLPLLTGELYARDVAAQREYGVVDGNLTSGQPGVAAWDGGVGNQSMRGDDWTAGDLQHALPTSTVSNSGSWTITGASTVHEALDEAATAIDTTTYVTTPGNPNNAAFEVALGSLSAPSVDDDHVVMVYAQFVSGGRTLSLQIEVYQGTTQIATRTVSNITSATTAWQLLGYRLTTSEAAAITDYSNLRVRVTCNATGTGASTTLRVSWITLVCPTATGAAAASLPIRRRATRVWIRSIGYGTYLLRCLSGHIGHGRRRRRPAGAAAGG